jgi:hypothetical protein
MAKSIMGTGRKRLNPPSCDLPAQASATAMETPCTQRWKRRAPCIFGFFRTFQPWGLIFIKKLFIVPPKIVERKGYPRRNLIKEMNACQKQ